MKLRKRYMTIPKGARTCRKLFPFHVSAAPVLSHATLSLSKPVTVQRRKPLSPFKAKLSGAPPSAVSSPPNSTLSRSSHVFNLATPQRKVYTKQKGIIRARSLVGKSLKPSIAVHLSPTVSKLPLLSP